MSCDASRILNAIQVSASESYDPVTLGDAVVAAVREAMPQTSWVGIYWLRESELVLGSFDGPPTEHTRIQIGRGVCGTAIQKGLDQRVDDVLEIENYLSCSPTVRSELVVLIRSHGQVVGQIDLDSDDVGAFSADDECVMRTVADGFGGLLAPHFSGTDEEIQ